MKVKGHIRLHVPYGGLLDALAKVQGRGRADRKSREQLSEINQNFPCEFRVRPNGAVQVTVILPPSVNLIVKGQND